MLKNLLTLADQAQQLACLRRHLARCRIVGRVPVGAAAHEVHPNKLERSPPLELATAVPERLAVMMGGLHHEARAVLTEAG